MVGYSISHGKQGKPVIEILISDSIAGSMKFAMQLNWAMRGTDHFIKPSGGSVYRAWSSEQLIGHRKAVVHVGYFMATVEGRASRRHLINIAESRGLHVIPYDLDGDVPEPLRICLICGSTTPCMWQEDLQPSEPGIPCTFDPTPLELHKRLRTAEKENAQLRQDLTTICKIVEKLVEGHAALGEEIKRVEGLLKAYRPPQGNHSGPREAPRSGGPTHENLSKRLSR
jgi:hypothetical protein